jgi:hypothetical protein
LRSLIIKPFFIPSAQTITLAKIGESIIKENSNNKKIYIKKEIN